MKSQIEKQFNDKNQKLVVLMKKRSEANLKVPKPGIVRRQSTLDFNFKLMDSERLIIFNKNSMDDDPN